MSIITTLLLVVFCFFVQCSATTITPDVKIENGFIRGRIVEFRGNMVYQFFGIPYAEAPIGKLRFAKPVKRSPWSSVLNATEWASECTQGILPGFDVLVNNLTEDCLTVNVFTTERAFNQRETTKIPVMVWIHGGAFSFGSANNKFAYDGTVLATVENVVVVSLNYRLGALGFLHLPKIGIKGNMGLWDQNLALKWVKANIHTFGGDANRVTIFGESAGSISVTAHVVSPASKGLFRNAIAQSGAIYDIGRWQQPGIDDNFVSKTGCSGAKNVLSCLQSYDINKFKDAYKYIYTPIYGDEFLPKKPENIVADKQLGSEVNLLLGTTGNEGLLMMMIRDPITFNPLKPINLTLSHAKGILSIMYGKSYVNYYSEKYLKGIDPSDSDGLRFRIADAYGDNILACPTFAFAWDVARSRDRSNVYVYHQTQRPNNRILSLLSNSSWMVTTHTDDILMVFGYPYLEPEKYSKEDIILSSLMMKIWGSFARTGKPAAVGPNEWKPCYADKKKNAPLNVIELNSMKLGHIANKKAEFCLKNWPLPTHVPFDLSTNFGMFVKARHDEF